MTNKEAAGVIDIALRTDNPKCALDTDVFKSALRLAVNALIAADNATRPKPLSLDELPNYTGRRVMFLFLKPSPGYTNGCYELIKATRDETESGAMEVYYRYLVGDVYLVSRLCFRNADWDEFVRFYSTEVIPE